VLLSHETGEPNQTVSIQLSYDAGVDLINTFEFEILFNGSALAYNEVVEGAIIAESGKALTITPVTSARLRLEVTDSSGESLPLISGPLASLVFTVSDNVEYGDVYPLLINNIIAHDIVGQNVGLFVGAGSVTIDSGGIPVPPTANFTAATETSLPGLAVLFKDRSKRGTGVNMSWLWDFGDGETSADRNPAHVYGAPGVFTVTLTVQTTDGEDTIVKEDFITIETSVRVYVRNSNTTGPYTGQSWSTAFATIQEGIDAAEEQGGGEVWVAAGVYNEERADLTGSLQLKPLVLLYGGFNGTETSLDQRNPTANICIIDGGQALGGSAAYHTVIGASNALLDGFTIRGGHARESGLFPSTQLGGGMYNAGASPQIANCIFQNNLAASVGGGMYNSGGTIIMVNCRFQQNSVVNVGTPHSYGYGGGIYSYGTELILVNCVFSQNVANANALWQGGEDVQCQAFGGALYNFSCLPTLVSCSFQNNQANANGEGNGASSGARPTAFGGAVYNKFCNLYMTGSELRENRAETNNIGIFAEAAAGGMYNDLTVAVITNCVFFGNATVDYTAAPSGSGMFNKGLSSLGPVTITNCTFATNNSDSILDSHAGGVYNKDTVCGITNCIFWNHTGNDVSGSGDVTTVTYTDSMTRIDGEGNINFNPQFVNLAGGTLNLSGGSPCIDAGRDTSAAEFGGVTTDIMGVSRGFNGTATPRGDGSDYDMGAYEFTTP